MKLAIFKISSHYPIAAAIFLSVCSLPTIAAENSKNYSPEFLQAIELTPDLENGRRLFKACLSCHGPEGWGHWSGSYPQIAGQLKNVIIKQLADFRAGNRDNPLMRAFSSPRVLGGPQEIADIAGYIANLPMTDRNHKGRFADLDNGKKIYQKLCADCHGDNAEGIIEDDAPLLYSQHFNYLKRQFDWIRLGLRRNADPKMTKQIQNINLQDEKDVLAYVASLPPPAEKRAAPEWRNPDFPNYPRKPMKE